MENLFQLFIIDFDENREGKQNMFCRDIAELHKVGNLLKYFFAL